MDTHSKFTGLLETAVLTLFSIRQMIEHTGYNLAKHRHLSYLLPIESYNATCQRTSNLYPCEMNSAISLRQRSRSQPRRALVTPAVTRILLPTGQP